MVSTTGRWRGGKIEGLGADAIEDAEDGKYYASAATLSICMIPQSGA